MILPRRRGDTHESMSALLRALSPESNYALVAEESRRSRLKLFAPHGGCIEPGTDQLVVELSFREFDYYLFRGLRREECYKTLHVTSAHFDEPACLRMSAEATLAISVHGCDGREEFIEIGGANADGAGALREHLIRGGYPARSPAAGRRGEEPTNFINRSKRGGIQMEMSSGFRALLFPGFPRTQQRHPRAFREFVALVRTWLLAEEEKLGADQHS